MPIIACVRTGKGAHAQCLVPQDLSTARGKDNRTPTCHCVSQRTNPKGRRAENASSTTIPGPLLVHSTGSVVLNGHIGQGQNLLNIIAIMGQTRISARTATCHHVFPILDMSARTRTLLGDLLQASSHGPVQREAHRPMLQLEAHGSSLPSAMPPAPTLRARREIRTPSSVRSRTRPRFARGCTWHPWPVTIGKRITNKRVGPSRLLS